MSKYIDIAIDIILNFIEKENVNVFLFGSRAKGDFRHDSDVDVGFWSNEEIDNRTFRKIRMTLEESRVPYHVDLIDFFNTDSYFKKLALDKIIIWNRGRNFQLK